MTVIAITGANGFVGRHLTQAALASGYEVRALSRQTQWLESLLPNRNLSVHACDLSQPVDLSLLQSVDVICHVAAYLPPNFNDSRYLQECLSGNAILTQQLLDSALAAHVEQFVYFSSGNIYSPQSFLVKEDDPVYPAHHAPYYLSSKLAGELFCEHYRLRHGLKSTILRVSSVYGTGMKSTGAIYNFINNLQDKRPVELHDGGRHQVDFVLVDDVVQATLKAIAHHAVGIYNVGSGQAHSILELAEYLIDILGANPELLHVHPPLDSTPTGFAGLDITKARSELGYKPSLLQDGLRKLLLLQ
jgi:UDP-glucose 4-epimerase